ncbi:hypothetical protein [Sphingobacterium sp. E70]|nr:hypothetical protein [Sphingobacterium sp. E70]
MSASDFSVNLLFGCCFRNADKLAALVFMEESMHIILMFKW